MGRGTETERAARKKKAWQDGLLKAIAEKTINMNGKEVLQALSLGYFDNRILNIAIDNDVFDPDSQLAIRLAERKVTKATDPLDDIILNKLIDKGLFKLDSKFAKTFLIRKGVSPKIRAALIDPNASDDEFRERLASFGIEEKTIDSLSNLRTRSFRKSLEKFAATEEQGISPDDPKTVDEAVSGIGPVDALKFGLSKINEFFSEQDGDSTEPLTEEELTKLSKIPLKQRTQFLRTGGSPEFPKEETPPQEEELKELDDETALKILQEVNGDPKKATILAKKRGFKVPE